ncbi:MAG: bifunctional 4-hydroxy-2-oxoglutarate aldolase/2-dehydro-3-deoxy-phosphogluconate aldolase [Monoglobaceae bacterium]
MEKTMYGILKTTGICPIMVEPKIEQAVPAAKALAEGGIPVLEILMRNENSYKHLNNIAKEAPEVIAGAGSVLNLEQAKKVIDLGARFIVMPGFNAEVVEHCLKNDISVLPGCVTATEIMMALSFGINILKFYPIYEMGGTKTLAQFNNGPFGMVEWVVTGGLDGKNFLPLVQYKNTLAAGGDWMFNENNALINSDYEQIAENTRRTVLDSLNARANQEQI